MSRSVHAYLKERKRRRKKIRTIIFGAGILAVPAVLFYFFLVSPLFTIRSIEVAGTETLGRDALRGVASALQDERFLAFLSGSNVFLFPKAHAEEEIRAYSPKIELVSVSRNIFSKTISVSVKERQPFAIVCANTPATCFHADASGTIFAESPAIEGASVLLIHEDTLSDTKLPHQKYSPEAMSFLSNLKKEAYAQSGIALDVFSFMNEYGDIKAHTVNGYDIFFTMNQSAGTQARILKGLLEEKIKEQAKNLEYIDLRVENRAYYKVR